MSNLLNELSVTMKEISKLNSRLAELESKELELGLKILSNEQAKKALTAEGIIVGDEVIDYCLDAEEFGFQPIPVFAHDINFDEPREEPEMPLHINCRSVADSVDCSFMGAKGDSCLDLDEPENESKNPFKVGDWVIMFNDETIASKVSYVEGDKVETENEMWAGHYEAFTKIG